MPSCFSGRPASSRLSRRTALVAGACALAAAGTAQAQQPAPFPSQPITLIVPYATGGTTDVLGRALGASLGRQLGQAVIIENKPGAAGSMGVVDMLATKPDGYRLTLAPVGIFRQPYLQKTRYDPIKDLTYIASFAAYDFAVAVAPDSPFKTVGDLVKAARERPGSVDYATPGQYTGNQVVMAQLGKSNGVKFVHIPYKGDAEAITALLGGHAKAAVVTNSVIPFMTSGKVRVLAIAADSRTEAFAGVPTMRETGFDVFVPSPLGVAGPKGMPDDVVRKLDQAVKTALADPEMQAVIKNYGIRVDYRDHRAYAEFARQTFASEKDVVMSLGLND